MANIGFIGLGPLGLAMATNLVKQGHTVKAYDASAEVLKDAKEIGIKPVKDIAAAVKKVDAVISAVPEDKSKEVFLGPGGILANADPKTLLIDCADTYAAIGHDIYEAAEKAGFDMLDAPISGSVRAAEKGKLLFMVRGEDRPFLEGEPILAPMAEKVLHFGPVHKQAKKKPVDDTPKVVYKKAQRWKGATVILLLLFFGGNAVFYALIEDAIKIRNGNLTVTLDIGPTEQKIFCRGTRLIGLEIDGC